MNVRINIPKWCPMCEGDIFVTGIGTTSARVYCQDCTWVQHLDLEPANQAGLILANVPVEQWWNEWADKGLAKIQHHNENHSTDYRYCVDCLGSRAEEQPGSGPESPEPG